MMVWPLGVVVVVVFLLMVWLLGVVVAVFLLRSIEGFAHCR
jgi:hypothetical protein